MIYDLMHVHNSGHGASALLACISESLFSIFARDSDVFYDISESKVFFVLGMQYACNSESLFSILARDSQVFVTPLNHKYLCFGYMHMHF